jgi:hypothetical protein
MIPSAAFDLKFLNTSLPQAMQELQIGGTGPTP